MSAENNKSLEEQWHLFTQTGDNEAYMYVWDALYVDLSNYAKGRLKNAPYIDVKDVLQKVFLKTYERKYDLKGNLKGLFFSTIRTISADEINRHNKIRTLTLPAPQYDEITLEIPKDPLEDINQLARKCLNMEQYTIYECYRDAHLVKKDAYTALTKKFNLTRKQAMKKRQTISLKLKKCKRQHPPTN